MDFGLRFIPLNLLSRIPRIVELPGTEFKHAKWTFDHDLKPGALEKRFVCGLSLRTGWEPGKKPGGCGVVEGRAGSWKVLNLSSWSSPTEG